MSTGHVITARGEALNLDQLIESAKRPLNHKEAKSEIGVRPTPSARRSLNVRAYVPPQGQSKAPVAPVVEAPVEPEAPATPSRFRRAEDGEAQTLADLTGIRVDKATTLRVAKEGEQGVDRKELAEGALLNNILGRLNQQNPGAAQEAERVEREETKLSRAKKAKKVDDDVEA
jgi:hypothetical protein